MPPDRDEPRAKSKKISNTPSYLNQVERGLTEPPINPFGSYSMILDKPMSYLLLEDEEDLMFKRRTVKY